MRAVILAGGKGTRLKPYTTTIPKPLVPIGDRAILEVVIEQLRAAGFDHVTMAVNHMAHLMRAFFGDGSRWGIRIDYSLEDKPLSTIGPLTLVPDLPEDFLVMNGDILCDLDYRGFFEAHRSSGNSFTVSAFRREVKIDFGVLEVDEQGRLKGFVEKPTYRFDVSMGIYCLKRAVVERLPRGEPYGFDNLMIDGLRSGERIGIRPFSGFWLDIGRPEDYDAANQQWEALAARLGIARA